MRRSEGARVIQLPSGCMPMISECACCAICLIMVARYLSGIQSRGSILLISVDRAGEVGLQVLLGHASHSLATMVSTS